MTDITITIDKATVFATVESLLWKYGNAIEGAENYKQVFNVQSEHGADAVDNQVLSDAFGKRAREAVHSLRDFIIGSVSYSGGNVSVTLSMPSRWGGEASLLNAAVLRYVEDGIMVDWLYATAPSEAAVYAARLPQDETDIKVELYAKKTPQ